MTVLPAPTPAADRPRAVGLLRVSSRGTGSALDGLRQSGAMKALFPRGTPGRLAVTLLNTAGGVTGGDRLSVEARAGAGSRLSLTTQAAERIYAALPGETGRVSTALTVEPGARLDWLPQETILYDRCRLRRSLTVEMAAEARLLLAEPVVFGRAAMGEVLRQVEVLDRIRISRDGVPLWQDALRLTGDAAALLAGPATGGGAGAAATVLFAAPEAEALLAPVRALLPATGGAGLARPDLLVLRLVAPDAFLLRRTLVPALTLLNGSPLPRSWML